MARPAVERGSEYLYTGSRLGAEIGLADYGFRDYAPRLARFTTVDPIRDGRNWYAYVGGDPVNRVDLWGLSASDGTTMFFGLNVSILNPVELSNRLANFLIGVVAPDSDLRFRTTGVPGVTASGGIYIDTSDWEIGLYGTAGAIVGTNIISAGVESGSSPLTAEEFFALETVELDIGMSSGFVYLQGSTIREPQGTLVGSEFSTGVSVGAPIDVDAAVERSGTIPLVRLRQ